MSALKRLFSLGALQIMAKWQLSLVHWSATYRPDPCIHQPHFVTQSTNKYFLNMLNFFLGFSCQHGKWVHFRIEFLTFVGFQVTFDHIHHILDWSYVEREVWWSTWSQAEEEEWPPHVGHQILQVQVPFRHRPSLLGDFAGLLRVRCQERKSGN